MKENVNIFFKKGYLKFQTKKIYKNLWLTNTDKLVL